jgi:hypothetical protein
VLVHSGRLSNEASGRVAIALLNVRHCCFHLARPPRFSCAMREKRSSCASVAAHERLVVKDLAGCPTPRLTDAIACGCHQTSKALALRGTVVSLLDGRVEASAAFSIGRRSAVASSRSRSRPPERSVSGWQ